jgi:hypothetical protein
MGPNDFRNILMIFLFIDVFLITGTGNKNGDYLI